VPSLRAKKVAVAGPSSIPAGFADPDGLDIGRDTSGHVAFGHGIHYCPGAPLAGMEAEVALGTLLDRFPRLSLAVPPRELRWRPVSVMNGLESLPASRAAQIAALSAAEQECCPFFDFRIQLAGQRLHLEVRAPAGAGDMVADLFAAPS
jgi:hypothetical protein